MVVFEERGNRSTRRKPLGAEKRTNKLNPHITPESNPGHIGECSHHCATPAPQHSTQGKNIAIFCCEEYNVLNALSTTVYIITNKFICHYVSSMI